MLRRIIVGVIAAGVLLVTPGLVGTAAAAGGPLDVPRGCINHEGGNGVNTPSMAIPLDICPTAN